VGVQVAEELPVRVPLGQPVRRVYRQRGLADPGHPVDRVDHHGSHT
jgi:hypothetical protein